MNREIDNANTICITYEGYLLNCVVCDQKEIFDVIFDKYLQYVHIHFGPKGITIFDGYTD